MRLAVSERILITKKEKRFANAISGQHEVTDTDLLVAVRREA